MALELTAGIGATDTRFEVTGEVPSEIVAGAYRFRLDDEVLDLVGFAPASGIRAWPVDRNEWIVQRGILGTTPATHAMGTAIEAVVDAYTAGEDEDPPAPFAEGGASADIIVTSARTLNVTTVETDATVLGDFAAENVGWIVVSTTNGEIPVEATILSVVEGVSAEFSESATATDATVLRIIEPAPDAGRLWLKPLYPPNGPMDHFALYVRNEADDGWVTAGSGVVKYVAPGNFAAGEDAVLTGADEAGINRVVIVTGLAEVPGPPAPANVTFFDKSGNYRAEYGENGATVPDNGFAMADATGMEFVSLSYDEIVALKALL